MFLLDNVSGMLRALFDESLLLLHAVRVEANLARELSRYDMSRAHVSPLAWYEIVIEGPFHLRLVCLLWNFLVLRKPWLRLSKWNLFL